MRRLLVIGSTLLIVVGMISGCGPDPVEEIPEEQEMEPLENSEENEMEPVPPDDQEYEDLDDFEEPIEQDLDDSEKWGSEDGSADETSDTETS